MTKQQAKPIVRTNPYQTDIDPVLPRAAGDGPADRRCMSCGTAFLSEGWHNRLCRPCARRGQSLPAYAGRGSGTRGT